MLNRNQRAALETALRLLESRARTLLQAVQEPPANGVLTRFRPLNARRARRVQALLQGLLEEIGDLARGFDLRPGEEDLGARVRAEMAVAWSDLHDLKARKLNRYGEVDRRLAETLDPHLQRMIDLTLEISRLAEGQRGEAESGGPILRRPAGPGRAPGEQG